MPNIAKLSYDCFARFNVGASSFAVGTDDAIRSGIAHDAVLAKDIDLDERFSTGIVAGSSFTLSIADAAGIYRAAVLATPVFGVAVTVEIVCTVLYDDGSQSEQVTQRTLTIDRYALEPGRVQLTVVDIEDARLDALYPSATFAPTEFRDIDSAYANRAIPRPVGTCLKLPAPQLFADAVRAQWFHVVCDAGGYQSLPIVGIDTGTKTITVAGDYTSTITAGTVLYADAASAIPGRYTVAACSYAAPNTAITVAETLASSSVSGSIIVPPTVLAVYRNGRLVASSEYTVELIWPISGQIDDSDFDGTPASWNAANAGTGTASLTGGRARFTGDGGTSNYGTLSQATSTPTTLARSYALYTLTLATGSAVRVSGGSGIIAGTVVSGAGTHTVPLLQLSNAARCNLTNYNTGFNGTVEVDDLSANTAHAIVMLRFVREQIGFDGSPYEITADVRGTDSRNAADEIKRLLTGTGAAVNAASAAAAASYCNSISAVVDVDHGRGREGGQRTIRALLDDLCAIGRVTLARNASGEYALVQDRTTSIVATLDEDAGDWVEVQRLDAPARPTSIGVRFSPAPRDPEQLQYTITRSVTGGAGAAEAPRDLRYLRDVTAADTWACYTALRAQHSETLRFRAFGVSLQLGQAVTISSSACFAGPRDWFIVAAQPIPGGVACEALPYSAAIHTYTAGTLPAGATSAYSIDYSQTPPAAPSAMSITSGSTATAADGTMVARITAQATPPAVNFSEVWLTCIHNTTNEIAALVRADSIGGGAYGATLTGLRPGEVYKLQSYCINAFSVQGAVQSTFNATAIGGGASVTTFTAPGQASLPADVASISTVQGMGRMVDVSWPAVSGSAIWGYVLERQIGSGAWAEVWRGQSTSYRDTSVAINTSYTYRVKARDTYGNLSANWRTGTAIVPTGNVSGGNGSGDLLSDTVQTANRSAASSVSFSWSLHNYTYRDYTIAHSLGKIPLATLAVLPSWSVAEPIFGVIAAMSSTDLDVFMFYVAGATKVDAEDGVGGTPVLTGNNNSAGDPHTHNITAHRHNLQQGNAFATGSATIYFW